MAFVLHFPCGYSLKKNEAVFLKKQDLIFSIAAGSILFGFLEQIFLQVRFKLATTFQGQEVGRWGP